VLTGGNERARDGHGVEGIFNGRSKLPRRRSDAGIRVRGREAHEHSTRCAPLALRRQERSELLLAGTIPDGARPNEVEGVRGGDNRVGTLPAPGAPLPFISRVPRMFRACSFDKDASDEAHSPADQQLQDDHVRASVAGSHRF
jgi:hypothetical protein